MMMLIMNGKNTYHEVLMEKFEQKKKNNPSFSLRAFARFLEMSPSKLSQILNSKQGLTIPYAEKICQKLNLSEQEKNWFCDSVGALHSRSKKDREAFQAKLKVTLEN